jgi:CDGSH-type Zn-finger protein
LSSAKVTVFDNGPIHIVGDFEVFDEVGNRFSNRRLFSLCRCGLSESKPFCDGTHRTARFTDSCRAPLPELAVTETAPQSSKKDGA